MSDRPMLGQCLCPERHCIFALAFPGTGHEDEEVIAFLKQAVEIAVNPDAYPADVVEELKRRGLPIPSNPWCALCGARKDEWLYEVGPLKNSNWQEAIQELLHSQQLQMRTRELLLKRIDAARRN